MILDDPTANALVKACLIEPTHIGRRLELADYLEETPNSLNHLLLSALRGEGAWEVSGAGDTEWHFRLANWIQLLVNQDPRQSDGIFRFGGIGESRGGSPYPFDVGSRIFFGKNDSITCCRPGCGVGLSLKEKTGQLMCLNHRMGTRNERGPYNATVGLTATPEEWANLMGMSTTSFTGTHLERTQVTWTTYLSSDTNPRE